MNKVYNILVFPGGNEVGMEIYKSLVNCKEVSLFSVSSGMVNHAPFIYKNHFEISDIYTNVWVDELNEIVENENIDFIFPAHAFIIDALAENRESIKAPLMLCDNDVLEITRSKKKTYEMFADILPVPRIYSGIEEIEQFPVFVKPDNFYGSQGADLIEDSLVLNKYFKEDYIVSEYLDGDEYTIDCFSDSSGKLIFCEGRTRQRIRMGTSMHSEKVTEELEHYFNGIAHKITSKLKITGPWFFQMKKDSSGTLKLLEIEPRVAGTMAFHRVKGINFPLLFLYTLLDYDITTHTNNTEYSIDRALVNRYQHNVEYDSVYIDLDDTIIVHSRLNLDAVKFLYQCVNQKKKVILISKSLEENKNGYLKKWKLDNLFDDIIWLDENDSKADHIDLSLKPIFIDDSFSQRKEVSDKLNINTFDPSMIELLLDDRA